MTKPWCRTDQFRRAMQLTEWRRFDGEAPDATVKRFHYNSHDQLRQHHADVIAADNFARRLKTLMTL